MTNEEAIKYLKQLYPQGGHCWLDEQRLEAIGIAVKAIEKVDALQKASEASMHVRKFMEKLGQSKVTKKSDKDERKTNPELLTPLNRPRELCKNCYNWLTQEEVGEHDFPCCDDSDRYEVRDYLFGRRDDCPRHFVQ